MLSDRVCFSLMATPSDKEVQRFLNERLQSMHGLHEFQNACPNARWCWAGLQQMPQLGGITTKLLDHAFDKCYCPQCATCDPDADIRTRDGWVRFGLQVEEGRMLASGTWMWDKAFHGTKAASIEKIIETGCLLRPGSFTSTGYFIDVRDGHIDGGFYRDKSVDKPLREGRAGFATPKTFIGKVREEFDPRRLLFVTPSVAYAADKVYAQEVTLSDDSKITVLLEIRMKPGFYDVGPSTVRHSVYDPKIDEEEMEWYTDRCGVHMITGLLVRRKSAPTSMLARGLAALGFYEPPHGHQLNEVDYLPGNEVDYLPGATVDIKEMLSTLENPQTCALKCPSSMICWAALQTLKVNPLFFDHRFDECFCDECCASRCEKAAYARGASLYVTPKGWVGFGLRHHAGWLGAIRVFEDWHVAYHGVVPDDLKTVIEAGALLFPGDADHNGRAIKPRDSGEREGRAMRGGRTSPVALDDEDRKIRQHSIFTSPSPAYAGSPVYAKPFQYNGWRFQVVLMARIKPDSYRVAASTLTDTPRDPYVKESEMEWYTPRHGCIVLSRILVRCLGRSS